MARQTSIDNGALAAPGAAPAPGALSAFAAFWRPLLALAAAGALVVAMADATAIAERGPGTATSASPSHDPRALAARLAARLDAAADTRAEDWALLARSQAALGDTTLAEAAFERALALAPTDAGLWAEHARLRAAAEGRAGADAVRQRVDRALGLEPNQALALGLRGDAAYERGEFARAGEDWRNARQHTAAEDLDLIAALDQRLARLAAGRDGLAAVLAPSPR
jgi:cytochrome c-type biogenesis protein CcmH